MKKLRIINLIFCLFANFYQTQELTDCLKELEKENVGSLSKIKFERMIELSGNRKVYEFSIKSDRRCMDCYNGRIFYDSQCKQVARFGIGRRVDKFVAEGYTVGDFGIVPRPTKNANQENIENVLFYISKNEAKELKGFEYDDQIEISTKEGLKHFRKGKLINTYKIIPRKFSSTEINLPRIYYLPSFQLYFKVVERQFYITKTKFQDDVSSNKIDDNDWVKAFHLIKQKLK
ncbi:hypothetical protein ACFOWU_07640 [Epilithonimonas zeae]|uniref:Uncharacterized protein n=1 Tax=Epilithonimonas zeae TaxID=1416779 RepID=A0A1N6G1U4_9FLAO|nr:hypothetical protein [Epilithonimonas zeae]SIO01460.1 hypothetical protein SAMN05444409_1602 [Epilithonimonas zeae]